VLVEGVVGRLVVVGVDDRKKIAKVATTATPLIVHTVPWSKLSLYLESKTCCRDKT
jgi:hypothetical protein